MHQVVPLGLPFARVGNLYWEDGGRRVLYVFPKLCPELEGEVAPDFGTGGVVGGSLLRMAWNGAEDDEDETED